MRTLANTFRSGWICSLLAGLLLTACTSNRYNGLARTLQALDPHMPASGHYVIIPNQGCEGCISAAESHVKQHYADASNTRYIFTRVQSVKLLKIKLGQEVVSSPQVLLDTANSIRYPEEDKAIYPMIVTVHNKRITDISYQSPESDGLQALLNKKN